MSIETYRYLLSSLIQVFGALIAVDAIFLLFRNEILMDTKNEILRNVKLTLYLIDKFDGKSLVQPSDRYYVDHEQKSRYLIFLTDKELLGKFTDCETKIQMQVSKVGFIAHSDEGKRIIRNKADIDEYGTKFRDVLQSIKATRKYLLTSMCIPAILTLLFCIGLLYADYLDKFLFFGSLVVLLSLFGFASIVYLAYKAFTS